MNSFSMFRQKLSKIKGLIVSGFPNFFRKKDSDIIVGKYGLRYLFMPDSALDDHVLRYGILRDWIAIHLGEIVNSEGVVFDIGANVGLLTIPFAGKHVKNGMVYAFEPDFGNVCQLFCNVRINHLKNVVIEPKAVQDRVDLENVSFHIRRAVDGDGLVNQGISTLQPTEMHNQEIVRVSATTIDKYVVDKGIRRLDFIKIDVEGSEYRVLTGGRKTIQDLKPIILYEFSNELDRLTKTDNSIQSYRFLDALGYKQFELVDESYLQEINDPPHDRFGCNIICFPPSKLPISLVNIK